MTSTTTLLSLASGRVRVAAFRRCRRRLHSCRLIIFRPNDTFMSVQCRTGNMLPLSLSAAHFSSKDDSTDDDDDSPHTKKKNDFKHALFPQTLADPDGQGTKAPKIQYPKTFAGWKRVFTCAWKNYRSTWEGFMSGSDTLKEKQEKEEEDNMETIIKYQKETISSNVEKNTAFVQEEAPKFFEFVQKETNIYTKEDLKRWAGEQLKLATLCVNEFMQGYRSGRDGEMDKMLNEYFKEEEEDVADAVVKRKRRRPKRLVRTA